MAADMLKARNAIATLARLKDGDKVADFELAAIRDLSETFEWLDESRTAAMKDRDEWRAKALSKETPQ